MYVFFDTKVRSGARATSERDTNVNEVLAEELRKPVNKKFKKRGKSIRGLKIIFGQQI